jgi:hypothetical protein
MEARYQRQGSATIGDLMGALGARSGALGAALLALPFLSPLSLGPVTSPASAAIAVLGLHMLRLRDGMPLPARLLRAPLPRLVHRVMSRMLHRMSRWTERAPGARPSPWVRGPVGRRVCGAGVLAGAALLMVPLPFLPLTNTFPALAILFFVLGWSNRDVRLTRYGVAALGFSVALFAALGAAVATVGWSAVRQLAPV